MHDLADASARRQTLASVADRGTIRDRLRR
jgi:hypothetical protein